MSSRAPFRLLLVTLLTTGLGLAVEAVPASAAAHGKVEVSVHAKKKKKHKKATVKLAGTGLGKAKLTVGGANQVAYGGHLLYEFSGDSAKGDMKGQGIGGIWHVVGADGRSEERRV